RSPLEQAMVGKHTLVRYLQKRLSAVLSPIVDAAVLPYTILPDAWDVPDAPREKLLDGEDLPHLADRIAGLLRRAHDPDRDDPFVPLDPTLRTLRRTHHALENVRLSPQQIDDGCNAMTVDQEKLLRILRHQHRAQISRRACTSKKHLALRKSM